MKRLSFLWVLCILASRGAWAQEPMSLADMFARADSLNASIRASYLGDEEAAAGVAVAKNAYLPSIDASLSLSYNGDGYIMDRNFTNGFKAEIPSFGNNFKLEVSQVIFAGGAISGGVHLAEIGKDMATLSAQKNRNEVRFLIAGDYIDLCKLDGQMAVLDSNISLATKVKESMQARMESGVALKTDVTRMELLIENLKHSRIQLESARMIAAQSLANALMMESAPSVSREGLTYPEQNIPEEDVLLKNSPALRLAESSVRLSEQKEKIAASSRLPQVYMFAGEYLDGPVVIDIPAINKNFNYWAVGVGIRYNIASLYKTGKDVRQSRIATQRAQEQLNVARQQISLALSAARVDYENAYRLLDTKSRSVELSRENYDLVSYRYDEGLVTITDLLEVSNQLLDAELQEVVARMSIAYNYYKLQYIAGTI